ncbi:unnamed protein product [Cuscuta epithymum]|uniref:MULE transposase domain-containing protein n=1 Tax=Cuscuta epithymum TaxID=186058 RepID=A0AAV0GEI6_9ASTE|nr:unnamed protein product [Cuscuta epithymum]
MYPIAWAVVGKENKDNWKWFIFWLAQELHLGDGSKITLISDMQKGLIDAVKIVLPIDEHRFCARHILANWGKRWHGEELKKRFWICAWSTFEEEFKDNLSKLGEVNMINFWFCVELIMCPGVNCNYLSELLRFARVLLRT